MRNAENIYRLILFGSLGTILILLALFGSTTFADSIRGFEIMEQVAAGGAWNHLQYPSVGSSSYDYYVAWWSPGQWALPYLLKYLLNIGSIQVIQFILISSCLISAVYGFFLLFKRLGFSPMINLLSLSCIVTNQLFYWHSFMYYGGDLFMLALTPFFLILLLEIKKSATLKTTLILFFVMVLGLFFKNTILFYIVSAGIFVLFPKGNNSASSVFKRYLFLGIGTFTVVALFYILHVSKGQTPGTAIDHEGYSGVPNNWIGDFTYSIGSPVGIFSRISFVIQKGLSSIGAIGNILQTVPFLLTIFFLFDYQVKDRTNYLQLIRYFCLPFLLIFVPIYLSDRAVSYEMRHFAPIAFVFIPGLIEWMFQRLKKSFVYTIILLVCLFDAGLFVQSFRTIQKTHIMWNDLKVAKKDAEILKAIDIWDRSTSNGLMILEDYWMPCIAVRKNDKYVLTFRNGKNFVVSGMELSDPDEWNPSKEDLKKYSSVFVITRNKSILTLPLTGFRLRNSSQLTDEFRMQSLSTK